jgi:ribosomal protein S18 acetylase RimI-like enzyme
VGAILVRAFDRDRDLAAVLELVGRSRARGETGAIFHPGGLQWWLRRIGRAGFDVTVLVNDDAPVGLALRDGSDVIVQTDAAHTNDRAEILAWVEARVRETDERELFVSVADADDGLPRTLLARGYAPTEKYGYELVYDLTTEPGAPELPSGFEIISLTPALTDRYIALHRAAWSRPNAPSTYDRLQHDAVTGMPDFRYDLVPIVAAPDGTLAAYCISWWDPRSASVEIEPLGTHPNFRRKGLARAIVRETLRRSWALRAAYALVWGASANPEAKALYESAGLRSRRVLRDYRVGPPSSGSARSVQGAFLS